MSFCCFIACKVYFFGLTLSVLSFCVVLRNVGLDGFHGGEGKCVEIGVQTCALAVFIGLSCGLVGNAAEADRRDTRVGLGLLGKISRATRRGNEKTDDDGGSCKKNNRSTHMRMMVKWQKKKE